MHTTATLPSWPDKPNRVRPHLWEALRAYCAREGHTRVPRTYSIEGLGLGRWVSDLRHYYRNGMLTTEQIRVLESLPGWTWSVHHDAFDKGLQALRDFINEHKHARVPDSYSTADGFTLGRWVEGRRYDYRKGALAPSRIALLAALPEWQWEPLESQFEYGLQALLRFVAAGNSADVPVKRILNDGFQIGQWVGRRRKDYVEGRLSTERIATLEAIPGWRWRIPRKPRVAATGQQTAARPILATASDDVSSW